MLLNWDLARVLGKMLFCDSRPWRAVHNFDLQTCCLSSHDPKILLSYIACPTISAPEYSVPRHQSRCEPIRCLVNSLTENNQEGRHARDNLINSRVYTEFFGRINIFISKVNRYAENSLPTPFPLPTSFHCHYVVNLTVKPGRKTSCLVLSLGFENPIVET